MKLRLAMNVAAFLLLATAIGPLFPSLQSARAATSGQTFETKASPICPSWFENAPPLGPGRPEPIQQAGIAKATVCRYLHAFSGAESVREPPLRTNLVSAGSIGMPAARRLANAVDRLQPYRHPRTSAELCGNESSGGFYVVFGYEDGHRESLIAKPSGCRHVIAGNRGKLLYLTLGVRTRLTAIAPPYRQVHG